MASNPLDHPGFWREFLKLLSFQDPIRDNEIIDDFCEKFKVDPRNVWVRIKAIYSPAVH